VAADSGSCTCEQDFKHCEAMLSVKSSQGKQAPVQLSIAAGGSLTEKWTYFSALPSSMSLISSLMAIMALQKRSSSACMLIAKIRQVVTSRYLDHAGTGRISPGTTLMEPDQDRLHSCIAILLPSS